MATKRTTKKPKRPAPAAGEKDFGVCVDFSQLAPGSGLANPYTESGITFLQLNGRTPQKIIASGAGPALGFSEVGLAIIFGKPAARIMMRLGAFAGAPVVVTAFNTAGMQVGQVSVPPAPGLPPVELVAKGISLVSLVGGNNEGVLASVCIYVPDIP